MSGTLPPTGRPHISAKRDQLASPVTRGIHKSRHRPAGRGRHHDERVHTAARPGILAIAETVHPIGSGRPGRPRRRPSGQPVADGRPLPRRRRPRGAHGGDDRLAHRRQPARTVPQRASTATRPRFIWNVVGVSRSAAPSPASPSTARCAQAHRFAPLVPTVWRLRGGSVTSIRERQVAASGRRDRGWPAVLAGKVNDMTYTFFRLG